MKLLVATRKWGSASSSIYRPRRPPIWKTRKISTSFLCPQVSRIYSAELETEKHLRAPLLNLYTCTGTCIRCCGSRMLIPGPGSWFFSIPNLGPRIQQQQKEESEKKVCCLTFFVAICKFNIIVNYLIFLQGTKKFAPIEFNGFGIRDPSSGIKLISDPGSRFRSKKKIGSRIRIRNTACIVESWLFMAQVPVQHKKFLKKVIRTAILAPFFGNTGWEKFGSG